MRSRSHPWVDERALALAQAVADKLESQPELLSVAKKNLARWIEADGDEPSRAHLEWKEILDRYSLDEILELLRSGNEEACRLRQSSPFAGLLAPQERWKILREYETK